MKKFINYGKIAYAMDILKKVREYIDPNAFIAGGFAAECYFGESWNSDIDIFFSSPNFETSALEGSAFCQLKMLFGTSLNGVDLQTYWYNKRFCRIAKIYEGLNKVDFIQIKNNPKGNVEKYVFDKFDINMCKISAFPRFKERLELIPSLEFQEGLEKKKLICDFNLTDHHYENKAQNKITEKRLKKYKERFKDFKIKEVK